ncbi:uncharacterized protein BP01DRAFT_148936 [Aspergillus saccharolyticus JOP 1030-1]|uniref:Uncharacterized protein n=1 Tax=Aspergillus saccharolyticus JOP 1030-1 TaxID=1450539 RepID=A0A318ZLR8_9EURO|nr:hypothetical protein BP01DRAFT_148936 [Aspergillus saccharolyticus JOP 1030-1]PYH48476.1 hypothetical protein BP01DRAFT_148936 [Aspergillus saccharolyticus JOP 1030-1]
MVDLVSLVLGRLLLHLVSNLAFFILMHERVSSPHCISWTGGSVANNACCRHLSLPYCWLAAPVSVVTCWATV